MKQVIELLGKKVMFSYNEGEKEYSNKGTVTDIILSIDNQHQISIDNDEFYILSDLKDFLTLD
jgi:hypothetical protein